MLEPGVPSSPPSETELKQESSQLPLPGAATLHLRRIWCNPGGRAVLMIHGSIENGRIFWTPSGKGLGPWLARQGYDVFIPDLQGRGESQPRISGESHHGMKELMQDELPALLRHIHALKGPGPMHWFAHSWGGVDLLTYLAAPAYEAEVASMVFFGSKRRIATRHPRYYWMIWVGWRLLTRWSIWRKGYLDAVGFKMGADNISAQTYYDTDRWVRSREWVHPHTGMDYAQTLQARELPPTLYIAGRKDHVLGNPKDVQRLAEETGPAHRYRFHLLARQNGHRHDYGHIDMLTHADAPEDVFPMVLKFMREVEG